jgi:hypothetical protein
MRISIQVAVLCVCVAAPACADMHTYGFDCITNKTAANVAIGEAQLTVDVSDHGLNQVLFTFRNSGPDASSICDVYFDDGSLLGIASLIDADDGVGGNLGVDFTRLADPGDLPGGNNATPPFVTTAGFSADSDPPVQPNGVNPGESLGIIFSLQVGRTFDDVIAELNNTSLRIGIHVQGFSVGDSESFVNNPPTAPVPGAVLLGMLGLGTAGLRLRRTV